MPAQCLTHLSKQLAGTARSLLSSAQNDDCLFIIMPNGGKHALGLVYLFAKSPSQNMPFLQQQPAAKQQPRQTRHAVVSKLVPASPNHPTHQPLPQRCALVLTSLLCARVLMSCGMSESSVHSAFRWADRCAKKMAGQSFTGTDRPPGGWWALLEGRLNLATAWSPDAPVPVCRSIIGRALYMTIIELCGSERTCLNVCDADNEYTINFI